MTVFEAIKGRRSVRKYRLGEVSRDKIERLLEAAMLAPSACNSRPWEFVVVQDRAKLDSLAAAHPYAQMLKSASLAIIVCARPSPTDAMAASFVQQDCAAATENILLAACELGLGTCWCGVCPNKEREEALRQVLGVSSTPFNIIAVGLPDEAPEARGRYEPERVTWL